MQSSDGPSIKSDSCAADEVLVSRSTKGPHESSETLKTEVLLRSSSPKPHPRFKRSAISLVSETDGSGDRETGEDVEADDKVDSPLRVVDLLKSCESVEQSKDPVSSPSMVQTRWRRDLDRGQEVFVDQKTNEKWAPAVDNDGRTYYYEVNSRHSVWTLADLDCLVDPLISPLSDPLLGRPRTAIYDEPNVSDGADNDNWSDSSFEYAVSPTLQTSEEKDKRNSKAVDENEAGNEKKQKPTKSKSSSRLAALARFKSGRSDLTPIDQPDQPSSDKAYRFEVTRIGKEHISGPKQNKLMNFERRGLVNRTKYIEDGQRVHKRWNPCLLVLSGPWLLFYKESKSSAPKVTLPHGKPEFKLHVQQMEVADAPEGDTSRKNVLRFEVNSTNDTKTVYLVQFPENVLESWKAAVRYAKELLDDETRLTSSLARSTLKNLPLTPSKIDSSLMSKMREFFRNRPTAESLRARGILKNEPVFASTLVQICENENSDVPRFVVCAIRAIEARGLDHLGIYRVSANAANVQRLRCCVNQYNYSLNSDKWTLDVLASSLKLFFRELKEPLFTFELYPKLSQLLANKPESEESVKSMRQIIESMPKPHIVTARILFHHLCRVAQHSESNQMHTHKLAMVFGPNLVRSETEPDSLAMLTSVQAPCVDFCLKHVAELFGPIEPPPVVC